MPNIPFTQYLRPNGQKRAVVIDRPDDIAAKAERIIAKGFRFECEELATGHCSFTISDDKADHEIIVVPNGPGVPAAVDRLVLKFAKRNGIA